MPNNGAGSAAAGPASGGDRQDATMLRVTIRGARVGMVLALPVHHPLKPGHLLLKPGAVLDRASLEKLREMRVGVLWIRYPALDYLARYISPQISAAQANLAGSLSEAFDRASSGAHASLDFPAYARAVGSLLRELIDRPDACVVLNDLVNPDSPLLTHSTSVCFLSLLLGLKLDAYLIAQRAHAGPTRAKRVENLGVGALLHDAGMLRISREAQQRWHDTGDESDPEWQSHVQLGFELVRGRIAPTAAAVALHHHQRYDGNGFPEMRRLDGRIAPLAGRRIHVFSRIVAVADIFDRLRNPPRARRPEMGRGREGTDPLPPVVALRQILGMARRGEVDPVVFRALLTVAPAYPPGSIVRLSDGRMAVVDSWSAADPCRPCVRQLRHEPEGGERDEEAEDLLGPIIELRRHPELSIIEMDGQDVAAENFYPAEHPSASRPVVSPPGSVRISA